MKVIVTIEKNDAGQRLDRFMCKTYPKLPTSIMYKAIRQKDIRINGKRCEISTRLKENDELRIFLPDEYLEKKVTIYDFLRASKTLDIVYEDENLMLLNKPSGLLVHPDGEEFGDTLLARVHRYLYEKKEYLPEDENSFVPALVNRIDRNTSGIVILAKNAESLRILNDKLKNREIEKYYLCIAIGKMPKEHDILKDYLLKDATHNKVRIFTTPNDETKTVITEYKVLEYKNNLSLLEIHLHTGRTHQIRAHLAFIGHPLLGDGKYGKNENNKKYGVFKQALCSYKLRFDFKTDAGILSYLEKKEFILSEKPFEI